MWKNQAQEKISWKLQESQIRGIQVCRDCCIFLVTINRLTNDAAEEATERGFSPACLAARGQSPKGR